jgi:hypothetical protein
VISDLDGEAARAHEAGEADPEDSSSGCPREVDTDAVTGQRRTRDEVRAKRHERGTVSVRSVSTPGALVNAGKGTVGVDLSQQQSSYLAHGRRGPERDETLAHARVSSLHLVRN